MERGYWFKVIGFFTIVGAIAALLVVPEVRRAIGLDARDSMRPNKLEETKQASSFQSSDNPSTQARPMPTSRKQETRTVIVDAGKMWVDTGITLASGNSLIMQASGQWANTTPHAPYGPNGLNNTWPGTILESANIGSLIGSIDGFIFPVGAYYSGNSPASGRLYLSINDVPGTYSDNWGQMSVRISYRDN
jgi:hypothetical protein